jgi:hypothetical protein
MKIESKEQKEQGKWQNLNWAPWTCKLEAPIKKTKHKQHQNQKPNKNRTQKIIVKLEHTRNHIKLKQNGSQAFSWWFLF